MYFIDLKVILSDNFQIESDGLEKNQQLQISLDDFVL